MSSCIISSPIFNISCISEYQPIGPTEMRCPSHTEISEYTFKLKLVKEDNIVSFNPWQFWPEFPLYFVSPLQQIHNQCGLHKKTLVDVLPVLNIVNTALVLDHVQQPNYPLMCLTKQQCRTLLCTWYSMEHYIMK